MGNKLYVGNLAYSVRDESLHQSVSQGGTVAAGGTDAGKIHLFGAGVPSLVVGVPVRYIHTHAAIMHRDDFDNAAKLLVAAIKRLDAETVRQLKS